MTPDGLRVRPMRWWDVAAVAAIDAEVFGPTAWSAELFWSELAAPGRTYLVAEAIPEATPERGAAGVPLLGYAGVAVIDGEADVATLGVAPAAQRRGLGRHLLGELGGIAAAHGARTLTLEVAVGNTAAQALYTSAGFTRIGVRRGYYPPGPHGTDALVLRRRLP